MEVQKKKFPTGTLKPCKAYSERTPPSPFLTSDAQGKNFLEINFFKCARASARKKWK